jgi:hypothetical protein
MKKIVKDPQLDDELQELYIVSKHWISDISFVEDEIRFLKNILNKYLAPFMNNDQILKVKNFNKTLVHQESIIPDLKNKILGFLKFVEPLINESKKEIGVNLIEKFILLQMELNTLSESVKEFKNLLFSFTEGVMITEKLNIFYKPVLT